jgi:alpha-beta hydrolase superfamily lysophospholipase
MGGIIAFQVGLRKPTLVNGCILLNPAFKDNPVNNGFLKKVVMFWGRLFPKFQTMKPIRSHSSKHSLQKYKHVDPYMYSGKLWTSTTWALLSNMRSISKR